MSPLSAFEIIGPAMVGPSSSHTAGAVKIGLVARALIGETPARAHIELHGSFAETGKGHATDLAIIAGLLGFAPDDERLKDSQNIAEKADVTITLCTVDLGEDSHPNAVRITLASAGGVKHELIAWSIGGGIIEAHSIDGYRVRFSGELDTLIIWNRDLRGFLAKVATLYDCASVNIATITLWRSSRGSNALTVIESDGALSSEGMAMINKLDATQECRYLKL